MLVALGATKLLGSSMNGGISPLFFAAVMFSAYVGGLRWGLFATVLSSVCTAIFFGEAGRASTFFADFGTDDGVRLGVFIAVSLLISSLQHAHARTLSRLERANEEAETARAEAVAASSAKDRFLNILGHELRNPLNPILGAVSLRLEELSQRNDPRSAALREDFELIRRNAEAEARLIDDLLDSSRIRLGKLRLVRQGVDLARIAEQAMDAVRPAAEAKGIQLVLRVRHPVRREDEVPVVDGDPVRLAQVFWNLLNNAVKFTTVGTVSISISPTTGARGVRVTVLDTGPGIAPELHSGVFEPFIQDPTTVSRPTGAATAGLGLGLSIASGLVNAHGGSLRLRSQIGRGSAFRFRMPAVWLPATDVAEQSASGESAEIVEASPPSIDLHESEYAEATETPPASSGVVSVRLLLVEDHLDTARVTRRLLARRGYSVTWVAGVAEALAAVERSSFDLVISDIGLADGNGCDLMAQLRMEYGLTGIAVSGYATTADVERSETAGFAAHLVKPVAFDALCDEIDSLAARVARSRSRQGGNTGSRLEPAAA